MSSYFRLYGHSSNNRFPTDFHFLQSMNTYQTFESLYIKSVSILLFLTGTAKLISASMKVSVLTMPDPLMNYLSIRQTSAVAGVTEVIVAAYILTAQHAIHKLRTIAWLSFLFITYHIGLYLIGFHGMCSCLGNPTAWLSLSDSTINMIVKCLLAYLSIGSLLLLGCKWYLPKPYIKDI